MTDTALEKPPALKRPIRHRLEAAAARAVFAVLSRLPIERASGFGGWLGRTVGPLTGAHRTAARNIASALPALSEEDRSRVLSDMWENFGRTMMEYAVLPHLACAQPERIALDGAGLAALAALASAGKPAVLFGGHLGNWEMAPIAFARAIKPITIVYRAANNPLVDKIIADVRGIYTTGMAPKSAAGTRQILGALGSGEIVMMLVDQKINSGKEIPFFGRGAFTGPGVAKIAMRLNCPVFPVRTQRLDGARFKVTVEDPWTFPHEGHDANVAAALTRINQRLEEWIRAQPGQWMWMHKRWPKEERPRKFTRAERP